MNIAGIRREYAHDGLAARDLAADPVVQLRSWLGRVLAGREELDRAVEEARARFAGGPVPLPEGWGGFRLRPDAFEFWQGREDRLHDRFRYLPAESGWAIARLSP
jgi:pyridoxamine 5'-phosphate oxidase